MIDQFETYVISRLGWPSWALRLIASLSALVLVTALLEQLLLRSSTTITTTASGKVEKHVEKAPWKFRVFQLQYLSVYLITMLADWLQGTNMYTLYTSYGVNVGTLFLTGFLSSAVFGTFLGIYVDKYGRKMGCIIFCLLEVVINLMEHVPSMPTLLVGRVLGGLSTSLLFTAFESWMVSEHRKQGYTEDLLAGTFSLSSAGNGLMAILAGLLAQRATDISGDIGPFQVAILLTIVTLALIFTWRENYGHEEENSGGDKKEEEMGFWHTLKASRKVIAQHPQILYLGLSQAFFEGAVYSFVFMWVPSLMIANQGPIPTGLVFSSFMLSMTFGGILFSLLLPIFPGQAEGLCIFLHLTAAIAMFIPVISFDFWSILIAFLVLEAMVGMFNSCGGILRSRYYPEGIHSSIMSVFRLPLNLLVVLGTSLADKASNDVSSLKCVFGVIVGMHLIACGLQIVLISSSTGKKAEASLQKKKD